jgi:[ribosomal protein S18]-alanine N-acetyltransferase
VSIRAIEARDVDTILEIQRVSPEIAQWALWDYERVARNEMAGWVFEEAAEVRGFLVARRVVDDLEILNLAVTLAARRQGIGSALLRHSIDWGTEATAGKAFIEVRASNLAALRFYERHGFRATGRRPKYYLAPIEDALLLTLQLVPATAK